MLELNQISVYFGGVRALSECAMSIDKGKLVGLIGPNGAGKTTAINAITGIYKPRSGSIQFNNLDITRFSPEKRAELGIGRTFQNIRLFDELTVLQNVMAGAHMRHSSPWYASVLGTSGSRDSEKKIREIAEHALSLVGAQNLATRIASDLSYGDQRRVEIARALACEPMLLCLDEPAAGMNEQEKGQLSETIHQLNEEHKLTILLIEHNVPMVTKLCSEIIVMNKGSTLTSGVPSAVLRDPRVIEIYLGAPHS